MQIPAFQRLAGPPARAPLNHIRQHGVHDVRHPRVHDGRRRLLPLGAGVAADPGRAGFKERIAVDGVDLGDEVGVNLEAAIGEGGVAGGHIQGAQPQGAAAEGQLGVLGEALRIKAERGHIVHRLLRAIVQQHPQGHEVDAAVERLP